MFCLGNPLPVSSTYAKSVSGGFIATDNPKYDSDTGYTPFMFSVAMPVDGGVDYLTNGLYLCSLHKIGGIRASIINYTTSEVPFIVEYFDSSVNSWVKFNTVNGSTTHELYVQHGDEEVYDYMFGSGDGNLHLWTLGNPATCSSAYSGLSSGPVGYWVRTRAVYPIGNSGYHFYGILLNYAYAWAFFPSPNTFDEDNEFYGGVHEMASGTKTIDLIANKRRWTCSWDLLLEGDYNALRYLLNSNEIIPLYTDWQGGSLSTNVILDPSSFRVSRRAGTVPVRYDCEVSLMEQ